jgi:hypothetical protein
MICLALSLSTVHLSIPMVIAPTHLDSRSPLRPTVLRGRQGQNQSSLEPRFAAQAGGHPIHSLKQAQADYSRVGTLIEFTTNAATTVGFRRHGLRTSRVMELLVMGCRPHVDSRHYRCKPQRKGLHPKIRSFVDSPNQETTAKAKTNSI